jgi:hypothetical protein
MRSSETARIFALMGSETEVGISEVIGVILGGVLRNVQARFILAKKMAECA